MVSVTMPGRVLYFLCSVCSLEVPFQRLYVLLLLLGFFFVDLNFVRQLDISIVVLFCSIWQYTQKMSTKSSLRLLYLFYPRPTRPIPDPFATTFDHSEMIRHQSTPLLDEFSVSSRVNCYSVLTRLFLTCQNSRVNGQIDDEQGRLSRTSLSIESDQSPDHVICLNRA